MDKDKNNNVISNPHDNFFRKLMSDRKLARDFLRTHLPIDIRDKIDLKNLILQPRSHINEIRKETIVDILYKTTMGDKDIFIYILLEHQSSPDKMMPVRMLKYSLNVISDHLDRNKDKHKSLDTTPDRPIPFIYPIVVYHGEKPYNYSTNINDLVDAPIELIEKYFLKPFQLIDLARIEDKALKEHAFAGVLEFALKHIFERDILPFVREFAEFFSFIDSLGGRDYLLIMLQYVLERAELSNEQAFFDVINNQISTDVGDKVMTLAEKLEQRGRLHGKLEGIVEGRFEGKLEGKLEERIEIAKRLIEERTDLQFIVKITGLPLNQIKTLLAEIS